MSWQPEIDELRRRQQMAQRMGGPDKVKRQHDGGKLTVRERIDALLDPGSFHEIGSVAGKAVYDDEGRLIDFNASNTIIGRGRIDGRAVVLQGDDFTVRGGAADAAIWAKSSMAEQMANELCLPIVRLVDGTGGGGSVKSLEIDQRTYVSQMFGWQFATENMGLVPVVGLALGSVAGLGAARVAASHYSLIVKGTAQMFIAGPPVVARVGESLDKETLGGSHIHARNGAVDDEVDSEAEAFARTRRFLSYLPSSVHELPARGPQIDEPNRREEWLIGAIPRDRRKIYDARRIIQAVFDEGSFFEIGRLYGRSTIAGLARLDGWPVAVLGSDPRHYGGAWTADSAVKATRLVDLAQTFHLPIVQLADIPGFLIGLESEKAATIRRGVTALAALHQVTVPMCSFILRKAFGVAGAAQTNDRKLHYRYAWPSGDWGSLPLEGGIEAAYRAELDQAEDRAALLAQIETRLNRYRSPFRTAEAFLVEEIVDPRDTRALLCEFANLAAPLRRPGPSAFAMRP
jgi:acetyl-CoA carboxylase carboxyltransferase component